MPGATHPRIIRFQWKICSWKLVKALSTSVLLTKWLHLTVQEYDFTGFSTYQTLEYDSFLCCTEITKLNKKKLSDSFSTKVSEYKGALQQEHLDDVLNLVRQSKLFTDEEKEIYFK